MAVLIIGAGNLGCALAADLCNRNHEVSLWTHPHHSGNSANLRDQGLKAKGAVSGHFWPTVHSDLGAALKSARSVFVTIPSKAGAREELSSYLKHYDLTEKLLIWVPGHMSSLVGHPIATAATIEVSTAPYGCRWEDGAIYVKAIKKIIEIASLNPLSEETRDEVSSLFPRGVEWRANILDVALLNTNVIFHPATVIMNADRIRNQEDFYFYKGGMTREVCDKMELLDEVRIKIMERFGFQVLRTIDLDNRWYGMSEPDLESFARNSPSHNATKGVPKDMKHRYLTEDCRILPLFKELALMFNIDTSAIEWVLDNASELANEDFNQTGITLEKLGMGELSSEDLIAKWGA